VGRSPELVLAFKKILADVADLPKVMFGVPPNCIVFTRRVGFLIIRPTRKELDIKFYSALECQLAPEKLEDGRDLSVTTDFRTVFSEVADRHLRLNNDAVLFPDWKGTVMGAMKG